MHTYIHTCVHTFEQKDMPMLKHGYRYSVEKLNKVAASATSWLESCIKALGKYVRATDRGDLAHRCFRAPLFIYFRRS